MRTAAYCRFSSDSQREASIRDQLRNIESYCNRLGWPKPALFEDQAISGSRHDRPGYRAMLAAADSRAFDVLLVDDLSRLSRDHIESAQTIRRLKFGNIRIIGVSDGTDTARDGYKLETGLRGLMSEFYLDDLAKKTHRGLMGQALDGYSAGGLPYGYKSFHDGTGFKREIEEEQAKWVRFVFERYAQGATPRGIADELNRQKVPSSRGGTWSHTAIYPDAKHVGMLGNPLYNGRQIWNRTAWVKDPMTGRRKRILRPQSEWVVVDAPELKIIDDDLWNACVARAKQIRKRTSHNRQSENRGGIGHPKYLFSGLLKCGVCGGAFIIVGPNHYGCATHKNRGESVCSNELTVRRTTVEQTLLADIKKSLLTDGAFRAFEVEVKKILKEAKPDSSGTKRRLLDARKELENLMSAIRAGIITHSTKDAVLRVEETISELEDELKAIERFQPNQLFPRAREVFKDLVAKLEYLDDIPAAREALRGLLGEVRLLPENGALTAETQSIGLTDAMQIAMVAGTGFEPMTFGL